MRLVYASALAIGLAVVMSTAPTAQGQDQDRVVPGGGITAPGWKGMVDKSSANFKHTVNDSKFVLAGNTITMNIGPAAVYWNPANTASGDYTISASFSEPTYMTVNTHPHPYGIFIGGKNMDTDQMSLLYCTAYGDGSFLVRGFSPTATPSGVFTVGRKTPSPAVHKAEAIGKPVTQDISVSVKGDNVSCSINGTEIWTAPKASVIGAGKLDSTDGIYGLRTSHNVDVIVTNFKKS